MSGKGQGWALGLGLGLGLGLWTARTCGIVASFDSPASPLHTLFSA